MDQNSQILDLLNRARVGDEAARDELFQKCRTYVAIVARAQVEDWMRAKVDASDLVQQTLMEAHIGFKNFQGNTEAEWLAWLRQILAHNAADFVRQFKGTSKRRAQREVSLRMPAGSALSDYFHEPPDPGDSPSQLVIQHEREIEVAEAISQLAPDYQEVIMLRNLQRLSFNEVADRMGRSRPATQMLWLRALRRLKAILDD